MTIITARKYNVNSSMYGDMCFKTAHKTLEKTSYICQRTYVLQNMFYFSDIQDKEKVNEKIKTPLSGKEK